MISITLNFTTLASAVAALAAVQSTSGDTLAIASTTGVSADEKAAVLGAGQAITKAAAAPVPKPAPKPNAEKTASAAATPAAAPAAAAPAASPPSAATGQTAAPKADAVDYPTLQKAVFKLAGIPGVGRQACTELTAHFEVGTFKELAADRWAEALAAVVAKTEELSVPA